MRVFLDTEFTGLHQKTTLVSIGMVAEDDRSFYAEFNDFDRSQLDDWLQANIIDNLMFTEPPEGQDEHFVASRSRGNRVGKDLYLDYSVEMRGNTAEIRLELERWFRQFTKVKVWSDCLAYDWVLFNNIWGHAFKIPSHVYYIPFDICTMWEVAGMNPDISREGFLNVVTPKGMKHNALWDAQVIKGCYNKLIKMGKARAKGTVDMGDPNEKYNRDPDYRRCVDMMEALIHENKFTPSEMREMAVVASIHYEHHRPPAPMVHGINDWKPIGGKI